MIFCWRFRSYKELRALGGYFAPHEAKNEIRFSPNSYYLFIRTMAQVSDNRLTFTVAMVTKMAAKIG